MIKKEDAMLKPNTHYSTRSIDYEVDDIVQITPDSNQFAGRIGKLIGITYRTGKKKLYCYYTVQFSDTLSVSVTSKYLKLLRKAESNIKDALPDSDAAQMDAAEYSFLSDREQE